MEFLVLLFFFGLAAGVVGKIKGSSFLVWFLIGFCLPVIGLLAAILYRWERQEPRRRCPRCGAVRPIADQVCTNCGEDMDWPEREDVVPAASPPGRR
jgi:peptidoglycan/LPS O-acetylase OafA/YrhL